MFDSLKRVLAPACQSAHHQLQRIFSGCCVLCQGHTDAAPVCAGCARDLPRMPRACCARCALPWSPPGQCARCDRLPPAFDGSVACYRYGFASDQLIHALKFQGRLALGAWLGARLAEVVGPSLPVDVVVPVPLATARLRQRGCNQALEIARVVAQTHALILDPHVVQRVRDTPSQRGLRLTQRQQNLRGAFLCRRPLIGLRIGLVDDVMTSGATLHAVAAELKRAGAQSVVNWVVARTDVD